VVGYGADDQHTAPLGGGAGDFFDFQAFSHGDFVAALAETLAAESLTRVLYPDDSTTQGRGCGSCRSTFWWPARSPI